MTPVPTAKMLLITLSLPPSVIADLRFIGALMLVTLVPAWLDWRLRRRADKTSATSSR